MPSYTPLLNLIFSCDPHFSEMIKEASDKTNPFIRNKYDTLLWNSRCRKTIYNEKIYSCLRQLQKENKIEQLEKHIDLREENYNYINDDL